MRFFNSSNLLSTFGLEQHSEIVKKNKNFAERSQESAELVNRYQYVYSTLRFSVNGSHMVDVERHLNYWIHELLIYLAGDYSSGSRHCAFMRNLIQIVIFLCNCCLTNGMIHHSI